MEIKIINESKKMLDDYLGITQINKIYDEKYLKLYDKVPKEFKPSEIKELAESLGIKQRTLYDHLQKNPNLYEKKGFKYIKVYTENFYVNTSARYNYFINKLIIDFFKNNGINTKKNNQQDDKQNINKNGLVYLIQDYTGYTKIGFTTNILERINYGKTFNIHITLQKKYTAIKSDETYLHNFFKNKKIDREWFDLNQSDFRFIDNYFNNQNQ